MRRLSIGLLSLSLLAACGCGPKMYPVKGKVHFGDGKPLPQGRVVVEMTEKQGAWGSIQEDGTFILGTTQPDDGVPAGKYRVYIANAETSLPPGYQGNFRPQPLIHAKYTKADTSGLVFEVPDKTEWDIQVEKP